jgi:hypothetical protein
MTTPESILLLGLTFAVGVIFGASAMFVLLKR